MRKGIANRCVPGQPRYFANLCHHCEPLRLHGDHQLPLTLYSQPARDQEGTVRTANMSSNSQPRPDSALFMAELGVRMLPVRTAHAAHKRDERTGFSPRSSTPRHGILEYSALTPAQEFSLREGRIDRESPRYRRHLRHGNALGLLSTPAATATTGDVESVVSLFFTSAGKVSLQQTPL